MTTVLTLELEAPTQERFELERTRYFPPALNRVPAHVTLFHALPGGEETRGAIAQAAQRDGFAVEVTGLRSLGRGVAYTLRSAGLEAVQRELATGFTEVLTAQDRQGYRPHMVVQNKASAESARMLLRELEAGFAPWTTRGEALLWWEYLGGPWRLIERFRFKPPV